MDLLSITEKTFGAHKCHKLMSTVGITCSMFVNLKVQTFPPEIETVMCLTYVSQTVLLYYYYLYSLIAGMTILDAMIYDH